MERTSRPVFFDAGGRRARVVNIALACLSLVALLLASAVLLGVVIAPRLPGALQVPDIARDSSLRAREVADSAGAWKSSLRAGAYQPLAPTAKRAQRFAFLSARDKVSVAALKANADRLDALVADWLDLTPAPNGVEVQITGGSERRWLNAQAPHILIYPLLQSRLPASQLNRLLTQPEGRRGLAEQLVSRLAAERAAGLTIDSRQLGSSTVSTIAAFLAELRTRLASHGLKLIVVSQHSESVANHQALARHADFLMVPLFEPSGPGACSATASQPWIESQTARLVPALEAIKLIFVLGSFATDCDPAVGGDLLSIQAGWDLLRKSGATLSHDSSSLRSRFSYMDRHGRQREVRLLDATTVFNQLRVVLAHDVAGIAIWRLGLEDPGVWHSAGRGRLPDAKALAHLSSVAPGYDLYTRTAGDFISASPGVAGRRELAVNSRYGIIVDQRLPALPRQAELQEWNATAATSIALTFDDGPNPVMTPKLLDLLAERNVKATFYIVGQKAARYPDILARIFREGHDIGNHTYSHPDLTTTGSQLVALELNAVQRVLEAHLGINTVLFRAPYAQAQFQEYVGAPELALAVSRLGYKIGGLKVDGFDWMPGATSRRIHERVLSGIQAGSGQTILLHDGSYRPATLEALTAIIDDLRRLGYRFVTSHELIGVSRDDLMPPLRLQHLSSTAPAALRRVAFNATGWIMEWVPTIAIWATVAGIVRLCVIAIMALVHRRQQMRHSGHRWRPASVAVLIPAYNEETVIAKTVRSVLASHMADSLEVLVIDDGSSDRTAEVVERQFRANVNVRVLRKPNGGKSQALNYGLARTSAEIVIAIDADTVIDAAAIELLVRHFEDERVGAVAGTAVVGNTVNLLTRMQALEYITSQNLDRRAFALINAISVVPGAIGAWRRAAVLDAGGYGEDTLAEDADLTIALERRGWRVVCEPEARAYTEAPESVSAFLKQRFRWTFGTLQVAVKNARRLPFGLPAATALVLVPNVLVFQFAFTLLAPFIDFALVWSVATALWHLQGTNYSLQLQSLGLLAMFWAMFQMLDFAAVIMAMSLDRDGVRWRLLPWVLAQRFSYRQLMYWVAARALLAALKGYFVGWGKLLRTGNVRSPKSVGV